MPHDHAHIDPGAGDRRVALAVAVNLGLTLAQLIGGLLSGSTALIADAVHNLSDASALGLAFFARRIGRRPTDKVMTFGYKRAELVAALINYTTLIVIGLYLVYEAILRVFAPPEVAGSLVIAVAGLALVVDAATAALTWRLSRESINIRAAFLHNFADALGSLAVIGVGVVIVLFGWHLADPIATLGIAGYILWMALSEIRGVIRILMLGTPPGLDPEQVLGAMTAMHGVANVHHLHLWQISEATISLEAHVVVADPSPDAQAAVKARLKAMLQERFGIGHVTLDLETDGTPCSDAGGIGAPPLGPAT